MRTLRPLALALTLLLAASAASAYTIYMKDGTRVVASQKYKVDGERALITLQNGTVTVIKVAEIDVARTDAANQGNYGTAVVLESGATEATPKRAAQPEANLSTLIAERSAGLRDLPTVKRPDAAPTAPGGAGRTAGGFTDFATLPHTPLAADTSAEIQRVYVEHGLRDVAIWRGTRSDRVLIEATVTSEATVFKALAVTAKLLDDWRAQHRTDLTAVELSLVSAQGGKGGQFLMTPEQAADLLSNKVEISAYYVANLQF